MEEELYMELDPEVEAAGRQLEREVRRLDLCWYGAAICLEVEYTWVGWWRMVGEWRAEGAVLRLVKVVDCRGCCHLMGGAGSSGVRCRQVWRGGCRSGSEGQGRICFE